MTTSGWECFYTEYMRRLLLKDYQSNATLLRLQQILSRRKIPPPHIETEICDAGLWSQISFVMLEGKRCGL